MRPVYVLFSVIGLLMIVMEMGQTANAQNRMDQPGGKFPKQVEKTELRFDIDKELSATSSNDSITIVGTVFYNDQRNRGLFSSRSDPSGKPGVRCYTSSQKNAPRCDGNWLGAYYMVVDVIELDQMAMPALATTCVREELIASVAVASDGTFSVNVPVTDPCQADVLPLVQLRVRTRFCGETWCISIRDEDESPYRLFHPGASEKNPLRLAPGDVIDVGRMNFNSQGTDPSARSSIALAANYYASIVDTAVVIHQDAGIPFLRDEYGEVKYFYPSTESGTATAQSPNRIVISTYEDDDETLQNLPVWISGTTAAHEYGHILMQRAWGGGYGYDGVGISAKDSEIASPPSRQIAFKEAWADFIARAVFDSQTGCARADFDDNYLIDGTEPLGPLGEGAKWKINVKKALCDWYDDRDDDDLKLAGLGDYFATPDLYAMWSTLQNMYLKRSSYGGQYNDPGLWFCDWVSYYLDVENAPAEIGDIAHTSVERTIRDLIYNNNIACFMSTPTPGDVGTGQKATKVTD